MSDISFLLNFRNKLWRPSTLFLRCLYFLIVANSFALVGHHESLVYISSGLWDILGFLVGMKLFHIYFRLELL